MIEHHLTKVEHATKGRRPCYNIPATPNPIEEVLIADQCVFAQGASKPPVTLYYGYHDTKVRPALVNVSPVVDISGEIIYAMSLVGPGAISLSLYQPRNEAIDGTSFLVS